MEIKTRNIDELYRELINWLEEYKIKTNCKGVVLGVSGGKDSTIVAMLAKKIWKDNVCGVLMPNGEQKDISDSIAICQTLGLNYITVNIGSAFNELKKEVEKNNILISEKSQTNIPPRLRMTTLYGVAQTLDYRVIGTGNLSESYIGWTTKWGDSAFDFNPIGHLTCTEVILLGLKLAKEFGLEEKFIVKSPSDGLTGKSDEDNFGFTYKELDNYILNGECSEETLSKIQKLHNQSQHKRVMPLKLNSNVGK